MKKVATAMFLAILICFAVLFVSTCFLFYGVAMVALACIPNTSDWLDKQAYEVWIAYDKFCNALLGGSHRETISSRLGKSRFHGHSPVFGVLSVDSFIGKMLDIVDKDHCLKSIDFNEGRGK